MGLQEPHVGPQEHHVAATAVAIPRPIAEDGPLLQRDSQVATLASLDRQVVALISAGDLPRRRHLAHRLLCRFRLSAMPPWLRQWWHRVARGAFSLWQCAPPWQESVSPVQELTLVVSPSPMRIAKHASFLCCLVRELRGMPRSTGSSQLLLPAIVPGGTLWRLVDGRCVGRFFDSGTGFPG